MESGRWLLRMKPHGALCNPNDEPKSPFAVTRRSHRHLHSLSPYLQKKMSVDRTISAVARHKTAPHPVVRNMTYGVVQYWQFQGRCSMDGQRGKQMRRRHSTGSARFNEIRGLYSLVTRGVRPVGTANTDEALRNDVAGDRRGTASHRASSRKGGGQ